MPVMTVQLTSCYHCIWLIPNLLYTRAFQLLQLMIYALNRPIKDEDEEESRDPLQKQLDNAPASFLGNIMKFNPGKYLYMSTRNNNFSNRAQKGDILVV